jgi:apolipoprotein N-acyltransferase
MADNRQVAYTLALVGGILSLVFALGFALMAAAFGAGFAWMGDMGGPEGIILAMVGAFAFIALALGIATGILLLVAAPRLRSEDEATRRTWSTWTLVVGVVNLLGGNFIAGGLAIGAGVVTLMDLQQPAPPARVP